MTNDLAVVGQRVARLPFQAGGGGASPTPRLHFETATVAEVNRLLATEHYLGPCAGGKFAFAAWRDDLLVACQVYRHPTSRQIPDGMLELSRWCLTSDAGRNAGSKMMGWVVRKLRVMSDATALVSYSELGRHSGGLYKASGWIAWPTHIATRYELDGIGFPSGNGSWNGVDIAPPKMRWRYDL